jgi:hypothetical protein
LPPQKTGEFDLIYANASVHQAATLHKVLPHKFRLEIEDSVVRRLKERAERDKITMKKQISMQKKEATAK